MATGVRPATALARDAGLEVGDSGALRVDDHQRCPGHDGVFAGGDCVESWHRVLERPINVQLGTHANKQGRIAGANATGADLAFPGVIGTAASKICRYEVARAGITEREAADAGIDARAATIKDRTRAGYYPGSGPIWVKLVVAADGRLLGGQIVGVEGAAKRIDVLAVCVWTGMAVDELELIDLSYAPPYSGVYDPILVAARAATKALWRARLRRARADPLELARTMSAISSPCAPSRRTAAIPPFLKSMRPPVRSKTTWEKSGSWPTTSTRWSGPAAPRSSSASATSKPAKSAACSTGSTPRASQASTAVSRARTLGLVKARWTWTFSAASAQPATRACSRPRSVRRRSASGRASWGSASPCRRSQSCCAMRRAGYPA